MSKKITLTALIIVLAAIGAIIYILKNGNVVCPVSYCIKPAQNNVYSLTSHPYTFTIIDKKGSVVKDFEITHTKALHFIIVRKDLQYYQHIHPNLDPETGAFSIPDLSFPAPGDYRMFADFVPKTDMGQMDTKNMQTVKGEHGITSVVIHQDVSVGSGYTPMPLGEETRTKKFEHHIVTLTTDPNIIAGTPVTLNYSLTQDGAPVTDLKEYLGAVGHSIIVREDTLDYTHTHPSSVAAQDGRVQFGVVFAKPGRYKIFTQFRHEHVFTTDFVVSVPK